MSTNKMWGGRFEAGPAAIMREITPSIDFDKRLAGEDLAGSRAHCRMLATEGIISKDDGKAILDGLDQIEKEIAEGKFVFKRELEDIHLNIEARLAELIGPAAGRLHTARSRNDQVVTDFRLWVRSSIERLDGGLLALQQALDPSAGAHVVWPPVATNAVQYGVALLEATRVAVRVPTSLLGLVRDQLGAGPLIAVWAAAAPVTDEVRQNAIVRNARPRWAMMPKKRPP